jgi:phospholipase/carboxylesterase
MTPAVISSTLVHTIRQPGGSNTRNHPVLMLLHGRGTNENDLLELVDYLDPRFFIVSVRAPFEFEQGAGGYTWYEVQDVGIPHPRQFEESYDRLSQFVLDVNQNYPVDPRRIFMLGFSMGSIMSLALSLTKPELIRGVVAHSGYIPENTSLQFAWNRLKNLSLFIAHGVNDSVIPVHLGRRAHDRLSQTEADLTYKEYPIAHSMSEQSVSDLADWLREKLAIPPDIK